VLPDYAADEDRQPGDDRGAGGYIPEWLPDADPDFPVAAYDMHSAAQASRLDEVGRGAQDYCGRFGQRWSFRSLHCELLSKVLGH